jgi:uncharacterized protein (DUF1778 family)
VIAMATAKPKPNRTAKASFLIRCSEEERALVDRAVEKLQAGLTHGAKLTFNGFVLDATLTHAREVLGEGEKGRKG